MSNQITQQEFAALVVKFKVEWKKADQRGLENHRTETALLAVLPLVGVTVKREWKDGDIIHGSKAESSAWYTRRDGTWREMPVSGGEYYRLRSLMDERVDEAITDGSMVEWKP